VSGGWFKASAIAWGLAVSTKLALVLYVPAFFILWMPPFSRAGLMKTLKYFGWMFLGYFVICFPQSIVLDRPIKFLISQKQYAPPMTLQSVQEWLVLLFEQAWKPALVILLGAILLRGEKTPRWNWRQHLRYLGFTLIPFLFLLTRTITSPHKHYVIPMVLGFLLLLTLVVRSWRGISPRLALPLLIAFCIWPGIVPKRFAEAYVAKTTCRAEAREMEAFLNEPIKQGRKILADPYFPVEERDRGGQVHVSWETSFSELASFQADLLALNENYYSRYLNLDKDETQRKYVEVYSKNWPDSQTFYRAFFGNEEARDANGTAWKRIKSYPACGLAVWRK